MSVQINYKGRFGNHLFQYIAGRLFADHLGLKLRTKFEEQRMVQMLPQEGGMVLGGPQKVLTDDDDIFGSGWFGGNYVLDGFFQNSDWYYSRRQKVMEFAKPSPAPLVNKEDLVMNVRLGDFRAMDWVIDPSWYLDILNSETFKTLHIVTDQIDYDYLSHFKKYNPIVVSSGREQDWVYLRSFDKVVCSNSTFCWWAMFFGSASKIYVFKRWVGLTHQNLKIPGSVEVDGLFEKERRK